MEPRETQPDLPPAIQPQEKNPDEMSRRSFLQKLATATAMAGSAWLSKSALPRFLEVISAETGLAFDKEKIGNILQEEAAPAFGLEDPVSDQGQLKMILQEAYGQGLEKVVIVSNGAKYWYESNYKDGPDVVSYIDDHFARFDPEDVLQGDKTVTVVISHELARDYDPHASPPFAYFQDLGKDLDSSGYYDFYLGEQIESTIKRLKLISEYRHSMEIEIDGSKVEFTKIGTTEHPLTTEEYHDIDAGLRSEYSKSPELKKDDTYYFNILIPESAYRSYQKTASEPFERQAAKATEYFNRILEEMVPVTEKQFKLELRHLVIHSDDFDSFQTQPQFGGNVDGSFMFTLEYDPELETRRGIGKLDAAFAHELGHAAMKLHDRYAHDFARETTEDKALLEHLRIPKVGAWADYVVSERNDLGDSIMTGPQIDGFGYYEALKLKDRDQKGLTHNVPEIEKEIHNSQLLSPASLKFRPLDNEGKVIDVKFIKVYHTYDVSDAYNNEFYRKRIDPVPLAISPNQATNIKQILNTDEDYIPRENTTMLFYIEADDGQTYFRWEDITSLSIAYLQGHKEQTTVEFKSQKTGDFAEANSVDFDWEVKFKSSAGETSTMNPVKGSARESQARDLIKTSALRVKRRLANNEQEIEVTDEIRQVLSNSFIIISPHKQIDILTEGGKYVLWEPAFDNAISAQLLEHEGTWVKTVLPHLGNEPVWVDISSFNENFTHSFGEHTSVLKKALSIEE